jgi:hypothetical protein
MLGAVFSAALHAQEVIGNWQGTMQTAPGLRAVLQISKAECNSLSGKLYSLGDDPHPISLTSVTLLNRVLRFSIDSLAATYEGKVSDDGSSINGTFSQGQAISLNFNRATPETAWPLDSPDVLGDSNLLALASRIANPYYIGFSTAAAHYGLTTQHRNVIFLVTPVRLRPLTPNLIHSAEPRQRRPSSRCPSGAKSRLASRPEQSNLLMPCIKHDAAQLQVPEHSRARAGKRYIR